LFGSNASLTLSLTISPIWAARFHAYHGARLYKPAIGTLIFAAMMLVVWLRCPTIITEARFWAEDGWVWYPDAYMTGWHCLLVPVASYLQTASRLVALFSLCFQLANAPKVFACCALIMQVAPAFFLLSRRMEVAVPAFGPRLAMSLLILLIPGEREVWANVTNSQWHLAVLAFLILASDQADGWAPRLFDTVVLLVSGLSGPCSIFLIPVALLFLWLRRNRWTLYRFALVALTAGIQLSEILTSHLVRNGGDLGATFARLLHITIVPILGGATLGYSFLLKGLIYPYGWLAGTGFLPLLVSTLILAGALAVATAAFIRGPWVVRAFLIFTGCELVAQFVKGLSVPGLPLWQLMEHIFASRYQFHPILAWYAILLTLICDRARALRFTGLLLLAPVIFFAVPSDFVLPPVGNPEFHHETKIFKKLPPGATMKFKMVPWGEMTLVKH
jgi:hypothetical protein